MSSAKKFYLGNPQLKAPGVKIDFTEFQIKEYLKCAKEPIYFIKKYVKIVSLDEGLIPFKLWDFQEDFIDVVHNNRFVISKFPRQSGKSTTMIAYFLHYFLFNQDMNIAILSNKLDNSKTLLHRLKLAYEYLPFWMQQGVVEWNKASIEIENGSKILAAATSSSAVRGGSYNCILIDEFAHVPLGIAEEFFNSVYPTITSGKTTKVIIVSTPKGMNLFYRFWNDAIHDRNGYIPIEVFWNQIPGRDEKWKKETIKNTSLEQFDSEFNCNFIGSTNTLIGGAYLRNLSYINPLRLQSNGIKIYHDPKPDHQYLISVDVSRGLGYDYHAFAVIDITESPYNVVCTFKNNTISPMVLPAIVHSVCVHYNNAFCCVETNDIGQQVADILHQEYEYENLLKVSMRGNRGQCLDGGFGGGKTRHGIKTSAKTKRVGCSMLRSLIEGNKILLNDYDIIDELSSFIAKKNSFQADEGHHDDLVMSLVISAWVMFQPYFKEMMDINFKKNVYGADIADLETEMTEFGIFIPSDENATIDDDGTVWLSADEPNPLDTFTWF